MQLIRYYYWQGAILLFLMVTYLRILRSETHSLEKGSTRSDFAQPLTSVPFDGTAPQIEFMNNTIKIRSEDPFIVRDNLILKSWTGALLGFCSVMSALFAATKLLPALYGSSCHAKNTWYLSKYPGATFALVESLTSISFLALLLVALMLMGLLDYLPRFCLQTLPTKCRKCRRRMSQNCNPDKVWQPNVFSIDYGLDNSSSKIHEYDCS